ncbi:MAG: hypothetical protein PVH54_03755, partial [Gammaproteobacteria bacterium]
MKTVRDEEKMAAAGDRILDMPSGDGLQLQARAANESMVDTQDKPASGFLASMRTAAGYLLILM